MDVWLVVFSLEAVLIIAGNSLVVSSFTLNRTLQKRRYYLLLNLSVADLLVGMVTVPLYLYVLHAGYHGAGKKAFVFCDVLLGVESVLGMLMLSWERLYAICWPLKHLTIARRDIYRLIVITWVISTVSGMASIINNQSQAVFFYFIFPLLTLTLAMICTSYLLIWRKVRAARPVGECIQHRHRAEHEKKLAMTLFIVTVFSLLAWLPLEIINIVLSLCLSCRVKLHHTFLICKFLQFGNSLINPIIYAMRMPEFRIATRKLLRCASRGTLERRQALKKKVKNADIIIL